MHCESCESFQDCVYALMSDIEDVCEDEFNEVAIQACINIIASKIDSKSEPLELVLDFTKALHLALGKAKPCPCFHE